MKTKYYLWFFLIFILTTFAFIYNGYNSYQTLKAEEAKNTYENRKAEFNAIIENQKAFLNGISAFLASSELIKNAYEEDDRQAIIELVEPLWKKLKERKVIREIHFFKTPAISYVSFSDLNAQEHDVSDVRTDIVQTSTMQKRSEHFFICKTFPGYRATYPIVDDDEVLGSVSLGIDITTITDTIKKAGADDAFAVLNEQLLKEKLVPRVYKKLLLTSHVENGYVYFTKKRFPFTLNKGYELIGEKLYSKFEIMDFNEKFHGYVVVVDNLNKELEALKVYTYINISLQLFILFVQFIAIVLIFFYLFRKVKIIDKIVELIKERRFTEFPKLKNEATIFSKLENNVIEMGEELQTYISVLSKQVEDYETKAYLDALTGAFNRHALDELGENIFKKSKLANKALSLILFDIDNFKTINDTYGHSVGDLVLEKLAGQIKDSLRESDILVRYGGEEFLIILPSTQIANAYEIAKKLLEEVRKLKIEIDGHIIQFTISIGLTNFQKEDTSIYDLVKRADVKLYKAKTTGKDKVEI